MTLRLVTIGFSHYCEKARWALDLAGLPYVEESHAPLFHVPAALLAGGRRTVPVLVDPSAKAAFTDSTDILLEVDRRAPEVGLYPQDPTLRREVTAFEEALDEGLGPASRRIAYYFLLHGGSVFGRELLASAASPATRALVHASYPLLAKGIARSLRADAAGFERSMKRLEESFTEVDARLEEAAREGRSWLFGDRFSAADLTFAALAGPLLAPPEAGFTFPPATLLPSEAATLRERLLATRAGRHAIRTYATLRRRPQAA